MLPAAGDAVMDQGRRQPAMADPTVAHEDAGGRLKRLVAEGEKLVVDVDRAADEVIHASIVPRLDSAFRPAERGGIVMPHPQAEAVSEAVSESKRGDLPVSKLGEPHNRPDAPVSPADPDGCGNHHRPVFVVGCDRSGTTLLRAMLTAHPHIAIPYEGARFKHVLPKPWGGIWHRVWPRAEAEYVIDVFLARPKVRFWHLTHDAVSSELGDSESVRFADILAAAYRAYARREGKPRWGDKTTKNAFDLQRIARAFPNAQFVHIVRDGRDVYLSQLKVDWKSRGLGEAAEWWSRWVWAACGPGERLGPERYHQLRYEDLLARPAEELAKICGFLGEPFAPEMLEYYSQEGLVPEHQRLGVHRLVSTPPDRSRAFRWRHDLSVAEQQTFASIAGPTLIKYGYRVGLKRWPVACFRLILKELGARARRRREIKSAK